jgi:hypothetical protein
MTVLLLLLLLLLLLQVCKQRPSHPCFSSNQHNGSCACASTIGQLRVAAA